MKSMGAIKTDQHYNVRVHVTKVTKEVDTYTHKTTERSTDEIISLVIRADTLNRAIEKASDHLYAERDTDVTDISQALGSAIPVSE